MSEAVSFVSSQECSGWLETELWCLKFKWKLSDIQILFSKILPTAVVNWCLYPCKWAYIYIHIYVYIYAATKSLQSCPTPCDSIDGSPPGSPVPGILQARTWEWVAISFSNAWKWKVKGKSFSHVRLLATPGTAAYQAPPSMGFSRQEYWRGVPLPSLSLHTHTHTHTHIYIFICV